jgi:6-phosphofructokinase 1
LKIGILTGGGDCAGINSAIRGATLEAEKLGLELYGLKRGWDGLINFNEVRLTEKIVDNIGDRAGTILGTSRTNPFPKKEGDEDRSRIVIENLEIHKYDALIAIGGEDTLGVAYKIDQLWPHVVGIPKTIDRDLQAYSIGYETAVEKVKKCLVDFKTTASSHGRVFVVEVFGRRRGHIAHRAGVASGADVILIPEIPYDINIVCDAVKNAYEKREKNGFNPYAMVVVAEGSMPIENQRATYLSEETDEFGHKKLGGISYKIASQIKEKLGYDTRPESITYISRSGDVGCHDSYMGETLGRGVIHVVKEGKHGVAVVGIDGKVIKVMSLEELIKPKSVNVDEIALYEKSICFGRPPENYRPRIELVSLNS